MQFSIEGGPVFTILRVKLDKGEVIRAEAGAMVSMTASLELKAKGTGKGLFGALAGAIGGESLFTSEYTATTGAGELVLAPSSPGDVLRFDMTGNTVLAQSGAYMAGTPGLELSTQGSLKAMMSGEGLFLQKITGTGTVFLSSYGSIIEKTVTPGEDFILDSGHMVAYESSLNYKVTKAAKGIFSTLASGEGLVCRFSGSGKVWYQTRNIQALAGILSPLIAKG